MQSRNPLAIATLATLIAYNGAAFAAQGFTRDVTGRYDPATKTGAKTVERTHFDGATASKSNPAADSGK